MRVLGIETSCDDTCASVLKDGTGVLSSVVSSQEEVHARYGGIVPELASRRHLECVVPVVEEALRKAGCSLGSVDAIAVTQGPGLIGSLLVGLSAAKAMAFGRRLPLVPVHHLLGHLFSPRLSGHRLPYPHLGLVVSGGHTSLYRVESPVEAHLLGGTRDDAAGEAFDKAGQCLGLPFPGGPHIDRLAGEYEGELIRFPRPRFKTGGVQFSFSGLKTACVQYIERQRQEGREVNTAQVCRSFQDAVIDCLVSTSFDTLAEEGLDTLTVCGGVAANSGLRHRFEAEAEEKGCRVIFAERKFCTDNAAMIAAVACHLLESGFSTHGDYLDINAYARLPIDVHAPRGKIS